MQQIRSIKGFVSGRVQGVGFRYYLSRHARDQLISGYVTNLRDGRVEFLLQGESQSVTRMLELIRLGPSYSRVTQLHFEETGQEPELTGFEIR